jgi:hypothetical protein
MVNDAEQAMRAIAKSNRLFYVPEQVRAIVEPF